MMLAQTDKQMETKTDQGHEEEIPAPQEGLKEIKDLEMP